MKNRDLDSSTALPPFWFFILPMCLSVLSFSRSQLHCFAGYPSVCVCLTPSVFQVRPRYIVLAGRRPRWCCVLISRWWGGKWDTLSHSSKLDPWVKVGVYRVSLPSAPPQSLPHILSSSGDFILAKEWFSMSIFPSTVTGWHSTLQKNLPFLSSLAPFLLK